MKYSFDTSIFIEIHRRYPRDIHPKIWDIIENKLLSGEIFVSREVVEELKAGTDDLGKWLEINFSNAIIEPIEEIQKSAAGIINKYPGWIDAEETQNLADPYVIAVAIYIDGEVVSKETMNKFLRDNPNEIPNQPTGIKIPLVCHLEGIRHLDLVNYFVETGDFSLQ